MPILCSTGEMSLQIAGWCDRQRQDGCEFGGSFSNPLPERNIAPNPLRILQSQTANFVSSPDSQPVLNDAAGGQSSIDTMKMPLPDSVQGKRHS